MSLSLGQYLCRLLEAYGTEVVFGIPGVHTLELYRGLAGTGIRHVTPRHEQGAGFMADGYARVSGKPGTCFIISGPGLANIAAAVGQAYADSVPMLVISSVNAHGRMGSGVGWLHEMADQRAMMKGLCQSRTIHAPEELAPALAEAYASFEAARPRPFHLEIPIDVLAAPAGHLPPPRRRAALSPPAPAPAAIARAAEALAAAGRPLVFAGGGALRAAAPLRRLVEALDAPLVMTTNARGLLPPDHPLGISLSPSLPAIRQLAAEADVVLALGTEFGPTDYDFWEDGGFRIPGRLIRADIDPAQLTRGPEAAIPLVADATLAAEALLGRLEPMARDRGGAGRAAAANAAGLAALPATLIDDLGVLEALRETLPQAILVGDSTQLTYAGNTAFAAALPGGYFSSATGFGTLGYALPAGIGAALVADRGPVVAIAGDGGLQFTLAELSSAVEARVSLILVLHDNHGYGEIHAAMDRSGIAPVGTDILTPDLGAIAAACGWVVRRPVGAADYRTELSAAADRGGCTMVLIDSGTQLSAGAAWRRTKGA